MKLIGISGLKTSGKDTAFELIKNYVESSDSFPEPRRVERRAFADSLKIMAALALGFEGTEDELIAFMNIAKEGWHIEVSDSTRFGLHSLSGRRYLQNFGAKARETFGDSFWVDQVIPQSRVQLEKIWRTNGRSGPIVGLPTFGCITDVRYQNEAQAVLDQKGIVLEIIRPGIESDGHSSEAGLPNELVSVRVVNDGTVQEFDQNLRFVVDSL